MKRTLMYVLSALILSSMVVIGLSGCMLYTNTQGTPSTMNLMQTTNVLLPNNVRVITGKSCKSNVLGIVYTGGGGFADALKDARNQAGGGNFVIISTDTSCESVLGFGCYGLWSEECTLVTGYVK
jgi:hypothetical protein